jgi:hypothetical protein
LRLEALMDIVDLFGYALLYDKRYILKAVGEVEFLSLQSKVYGLYFEQLEQLY